MNYWWVNQKSTNKEEISGGYMWSPKKNKNGNNNEFYNNMTRVRPGDIVFSYFDTKIQYIGVIKSKGYTQPRPEEFGQAGEAWDEDGWQVDVQYHALSRKLKPKDHIDILRPLLPSKYSPLQPSGKANQVYLANVLEPMAEALLSLLEDQASPALRASAQATVIDFEAVQQQLEQDVEASLADTDEKRRERLQKANGKAEQVQVTTTTYKRNADVVAEVLKRAKGVCEKCNSSAPFNRAKDGTPYLEVHHWQHLSKGGEDTVENAGALCPNCHREAHFG